MAKILLNKNYIDKGDVKHTGKYLFDVEDGTPSIELVVWNEKSKATEKHPDGKPWIKLPNGNITNRTYFSEDLFIATENGLGYVTVEVKTTAPRTLGASGVKQEVSKYLSSAEAAEYTELVNSAVDKFKVAKVSNKKKKPEEMNKEELEAYITALRNKTPLTIATGPKSFLDMFTEEQYNRYNELLATSAANKANAPKATRRPLTEEEKALNKDKREAKELSRAEALLKALENSVTPVGIGIDYTEIGDDTDVDYPEVDSDEDTDYPEDNE